MTPLARRAQICHERLGIQWGYIDVAGHDHLEVSKERLRLGGVHYLGHGQISVVGLGFGQIERFVHRRTVGVTDQLVHEIAETRRDEPRVVADDEVGRHGYSLARG